jgi:hypothetical protein
MNLSKALSVLLPLTLTLAACGAPVTNVTVVVDDAGHTTYVESDAAPPTPETVVVKVEYPDAGPSTTIVVKTEAADAGTPKAPPTSDAAPAITCPDVTTCGTVMGPIALTCLANIDICYATRSTVDPVDDTDNHYDACMDLCQAALFQCQAQFVNPDGTIIGADDSGVLNETGAYNTCAETYVDVCCGGCDG